MRQHTGHRWGRRQPTPMSIPQELDFEKWLPVEVLEAAKKIHNETDEHGSIDDLAFMFFSMACVYEICLKLRWKTINLKTINYLMEQIAIHCPGEQAP